MNTPGIGRTGKRNAVELAEAKVANESSSAKDPRFQELIRRDAGEVAQQLAVAERMNAVEKERDICKMNWNRRSATSKPYPSWQRPLIDEVQKAAAKGIGEIQELKAKLDAIVKAGEKACDY